MRENLDDLTVVVPCVFHGLNVGRTNVTPFAHDLRGELQGCKRLRVRRSTIPVRGDFGVVELGQVLSEVSMSRKAIVAAIDFGHGERDPLASACVELSLSESAGKAEIPFEGHTGGVPALSGTISISRLWSQRGPRL